MALAADLARQLRGGEVIFLSGDFGSGKTVFVKGLAAALGIDPASVTSPSFTLAQSYFGSLTIHHVDLYRLENQEAIAELAMEDLVSPSAVLVIEWAQHWHSPSLPPTYRIDFSHEAPEARRIIVCGRPGCRI